MAISGSRAILGVVSRSETLDLQPGDCIVWGGPDLDLPPNRIIVGMVGKVLKASDNPLADRVRKELGISLADAAWALVEFENGAKVVVSERDRFEKVREQ